MEWHEEATKFVHGGWSEGNDINDRLAIYLLDSRETEQYKHGCAMLCVPWAVLCGTGFPFNAHKIIGAKREVTKKEILSIILHNP